MWKLTQSADYTGNESSNSPAVPVLRTNFSCMAKADPAAFAHNLRQLDDAKPFQLLDDDGFIYFTGFADSDEDMLNCLDDFGEAYGCTTVMVKDECGWVNLN